MLHLTCYLILPVLELCDTTHIWSNLSQRPISIFAYWWEFGCLYAKWCKKCGRKYRIQLQCGLGLERWKTSAESLVCGGQDWVWRWSEKPVREICSPRTGVCQQWKCSAMYALCSALILKEAWGKLLAYCIGNSLFLFFLNGDITLKSNENRIYRGYCQVREANSSLEPIGENSGEAMLTFLLRMLTHFPACIHSPQNTDGYILLSSMAV